MGRKRPRLTVHFHYQAPGAGGLLSLEPRVLVPVVASLCLFIFSWLCLLFFKMLSTRLEPRATTTPPFPFLIRRVVIKGWKMSGHQGQQRVGATGGERKNRGTRMEEDVMQLLLLMKE